MKKNILNLVSYLKNSSNFAKHFESQLKIHLSIWGSGTGSNAEAILQYFSNHSSISIASIISDKQDAKILSLPEKYQNQYPKIQTLFLDKNLRNQPEKILEILKNQKVDYIILAGYLKLIPQILIDNFPNRILNIHPSLLPKFGGKGMYGIYVHEAVIKNQEKESGLTIHLVNEEYDKGEILFQKSLPVLTQDPYELQKEILQLEHFYYPKVIENYIFTNHSINKMKTIDIKKAFISVYDKTGLDAIIHELKSRKVELYASGGTADFIKSLGYDCIDISEITQYPSILGGRVKTLHPKVFGAILAKREDITHIQDLHNHQIDTFDLVIVDLYPFEKGLKEGLPFEKMIELIDIGGVSLIRAAAKNFLEVVIVPSVQYYDTFLQHYKNEVFISYEMRKKLSVAAFQVTYQYDLLIGNYLAGENTLRYGENPHQKAQFLGNYETVFSKISGKELSYNNFLDIDSALRIIADFPQTTCAIIKHTNPCGIATRSNVLEAWKTALSSDPTSAFGGIIVFNDEIDAETAKAINEIFFEVLIAPNYSEEAKSILTQNAKRIILKLNSLQLPDRVIRTCLNGLLVQEIDNIAYQTQYEYVTNEKPNDTEIKDLQFAETCVKHLKSNAIAIVKDKQLIGSGMGQTSRIDALKQAIQKCKERGFDTQNAVLASDAFFPFNDAVQVCYENGIKTILQPGGSIRDKDSIQFCNEKQMKMVFTGIRHFKH